jgi:hypothetical protein
MQQVTDWLEKLGMGVDSTLVDSRSAEKAGGPLARPAGRSSYFVSAPSTFTLRA